MKKMLSIIAVSAVTLLLSTGCTTSTDGLEASGSSAHGGTSLTGDNQGHKNAIYVGHTDSKIVIKAIKAAGEKTGWRVTEFKSDAVLVEKIADGRAMSSTIKYHNGHISGSSEHADMSELKELREAIVDELKSGSSHH